MFTKNTLENALCYNGKRNGKTKNIRLLNILDPKRLSNDIEGDSFSHESHLKLDYLSLLSKGAPTFIFKYVHSILLGYPTNNNSSLKLFRPGSKVHQMSNPNLKFWVIFFKKLHKNTKHGTSKGAHFSDSPYICHCHNLSNTSISMEINYLHTF